MKILLIIISFIIILSGCNGKDRLSNSEEPTIEVQTSSIEETTSTESRINETTLDMDETELYAYALKCFENENFMDALNCFILLNDYEKSKQYIDFCRLIINMQGDWKIGSDSDISETYEYWYPQYKNYPLQLKIDGFSLIIDNKTYKLRPVYRFAPYYTTASTDETGNAYTFCTNYSPGQYTCILHLADTEFKEGQLMVPDDNGVSVFHSENHKNSEYLSPTQSTVMRDSPRIGMTKEEAANSSWGEPSYINRTITQYGVYEQWCYSGSNYLYLTDGIVTSIQERE